MIHVHRHARRLLAVGALAVVSLGVTACGDDETPLAEVRVEGSGAVTLEPGQPLVVALPANPTTGYQWEISVPPDVAVLAQDGLPEYAQSPSSTDMVGVGGITTVRFLAEAPGETVVVLSYRRPFEPTEPDAETVTVEVTVVDGADTTSPAGEPADTPAGEPAGPGPVSE